jgi:hypothetical protein
MRLARGNFSTGCREARVACTKAVRPHGMEDRAILGCPSGESETNRSMGEESYGVRL